MSKAYFVAEQYEPPLLPPGRKWIVLRLSMGILGKDRCEKGIPASMKKVVVPPFLMVATDRQAAKDEIMAKLDAMFDAWEASQPC
jgi:hypothetical protein